MTKDNIMIAALRLFLLRGYRNVSLVDVANEIGITKGGIYHYFKSKEELFHSVIDYLFDHFEIKYAELFSKENSFRGILEFMLGGEQEVYIRRLLNIKDGDYRASNANLALEIMHNFPEIQDRIDHGQLELKEKIKEKLENAQNAGEIRQDLDAHILAMIILSISSGLNILGNHLNTPVMHKQIIDSLWQLIGSNTLKE
ncbi:TetR/AcrR family transcriptional regulator [Pelosinus sp. sgz500959]|uniref:TetR/AcrR family transcriptional regulator n=1 Tax=Pelosinus sp. sgz500959 TaxID=3242472 RepID=UPI00366FF40C